MSSSPFLPELHPVQPRFVAAPSPSELEDVCNHRNVKISPAWLMSNRSSSLEGKAVSFKLCITDFLFKFLFKSCHASNSILQLSLEMPGSPYWYCGLMSELSSLFDNDCRCLSNCFTFLIVFI